jgi:DNA-binding CsgD family transcriptional regulator
VDLVPARQLLVWGRAEGYQPAALAQQAVRAVKHGTADRVDDDVRGRHGPRWVSGREALTLTEVKIAALVARGDSTSDIARGMFLSRRTVQTYISRILTKLGATNGWRSSVRRCAGASRPSATAGRCIAAKVSSYDHYSRPRLAGCIEECPAPGTAKPRDGHLM